MDVVAAMYRASRTFRSIVCLIPLVLQFVTGCSNGQCSPRADTEPLWNAIGLPAIKGASVCSSSVNQHVFVHHNKEHFWFVQEYVDALEKDGWSRQHDLSSSDPYSRRMTKGDATIRMSVRKCDSPSIAERFSPCAIVKFEHEE